MTIDRNVAGPTAIRKEAARSMRILEEDVYELLDHARVFRERVDPAWPPQDWPPDVTTGDDIRNWLQGIDERLAKTEQMLDALCRYLLPKSDADSLESHEVANEDDADHEADKDSPWQAAPAGDDE